MFNDRPTETLHVLTIFKFRYEKLAQVADPQNQSCSQPSVKILKVVPYVI